MAVVAMKQLLEAGVTLDIKQEDGNHKWQNTYSKLEMVFTSSILQKTSKKLDEAYAS